MNAARWRPRLARTLEAIAGEASQFADDWWIIGSAAAAVSGADITEIRDVDLLLSERDAAALFARWDGAPREAADADLQFRSARFARFLHTPLPIEAFAGFEMRKDGNWRPVLPQTRERRGGCFTPSIAEQIALLEAMGRQKDSVRIKALRALL